MSASSIPAYLSLRAAPRARDRRSARKRYIRRTAAAALPTLATSRAVAHHMRQPKASRSCQRGLRPRRPLQLRGRRRRPPPRPRQSTHPLAPFGHFRSGGPTTRRALGLHFLV